MNINPTTSAMAVKNGDEKQLRQVAKQFEAVFLKELFKGLEQEQGDSGALFDEGNAASTWRELRNQQMAENAAGGMGIADLLVRDLMTRRGTPRA